LEPVATESVHEASALETVDEEVVAEEDQPEEEFVFDDSLNPLYFTSADNILQKKGFKVTFKDYEGTDDKTKGYVQILDSSNTVSTAFSAGKLSIPSLNQYLLRQYPEIFRDAALFPLDARSGSAFEPGSLALDFPVASIYAGATADEKRLGDLSVYQRFLSTKIVDYRGYVNAGGSLSWSKGLKVRDTVPFKIVGRSLIFTFPDDVPFYYIVRDLEDETIRILREEEGLFVNHTDSGMFAVSNWEGARFFLPPNSVVAGNRRVDLLSSPVVVTKKDEARVSSPVLLSNVSDDSSTSRLEKLFEEVKKITEPFTSSPSGSAYRHHFVGNKTVTQFMRLAKDLKKVDLGTRQRSSVTVVRESFKDGTWGDLWETVLAKARDDISAYYLMGNLNSQIQEYNGNPVFRT